MCPFGNAFIQHIIKINMKVSMIFLNFHLSMYLNTNTNSVKLYQDCCFINPLQDNRPHQQHPVPGSVPERLPEHGDGGGHAAVDRGALQAHGDAHCALPQHPRQHPRLLHPAAPRGLTAAQGRLKKKVYLRSYRKWIEGWVVSPNFLTIISISEFYIIFNSTFNIIST